MGKIAARAGLTKGPDGVWRLDGRLAITCSYVMLCDEMVPGPCERHLWHAVAAELIRQGRSELALH